MSVRFVIQLIQQQLDLVERRGRRWGRGGRHGEQLVEQLVQLDLVLDVELQLVDVHVLQFGRHGVPAG